MADLKVPSPLPYRIEIPLLSWLPTARSDTVAIEVGGGNGGGMRACRVVMDRGEYVIALEEAAVEIGVGNTPVGVGNLGVWSVRRH